MVDITQIALGVLSIIGGATTILRVVAPLTKNKKDDHVLKYLQKFLEALSLDSKSTDKEEDLKIKLKR